MGVLVLVIIHHRGPQGEGADIGHNNIPNLPLALLDAGADPHPAGDDGIRVVQYQGGLAEEGGEEVRQHRQLGGAAHQNHVVNFPDAPAAVPDGPGQHLLHPVKQILAELRKQVPRQGEVIGGAVRSGEDHHRHRAPGEGAFAPLRLAQQHGLLLGA